MNKKFWPNGKDFAFTIVDDTDNCTIENIKPVYDYLFKIGLLTTKTIWTYPPNDRFTGLCLQDEKYLKYIKVLKKQGFEIAIHGVGSGSFTRDEILKGLEIYKSFLKEYPSMHINHAQNLDNIYFGNRGGSKLLQRYSKIKSPLDKAYGEDKNSKHFWGDWVKKNIKYTRGRTFKNINTLAQDPKMPFLDKDKEKYSNYWFSSSDGANIDIFNKLLSFKNIDKLNKENGLCIVYTHFASGFVDSEGKLNNEFKEKLYYLVSKNGWFVPTSQILNYLLSKKKNHYANEFYLTYLDLKNLLKAKFSIKR